MQEEIHWYQKSRDDWIKLAYRNTKVLHTKTVIRRKINKFHGLHLPNGVWCIDDVILIEEALSLFKDLFFPISPILLTSMGGSTMTLILMNKPNTL